MAAAKMAARISRSVKTACGVKRAVISSTTNVSVSLFSFLCVKDYISLLLGEALLIYTVAQAVDFIKDKTLFITLKPLM